jgi:hypothetical protein
VDDCLLIKRRLVELGFERKDLATAVEVTGSYISKVLTRRKYPPRFTHRFFYRDIEVLEASGRSAFEAGRPPARRDKGCSYCYPLVWASWKLARSDKILSCVRWSTTTYSPGENTSSSLNTDHRHIRRGWRYGQPYSSATLELTLRLRQQPLLAFPRLP